MTHGSLFSGIGGFDLAAEWAGWENKFHCEWNEFGQRVLNYYWPDAVCYGDITKTDFTIWRGRIDVLTGGFPCQPYSTAGKRLGKEDERHLWPEMLRAIQEIQPKYVVGENVPGLINWSGGLVFEEVQSDLEAAGYEVIPFILPAASVNAPHRRERVWFVAYRNSAGLQTQRAEQQTAGVAGSSIQGTTPNPASDRREWERTGIENEKGLQQRPESTRKLEGGFEGLCIQRTATYPTGQLQQGNEPRKCGTEGREVVQQKYRFTNTEQPRTMGKNGNAPNSERTGLQKSEQSEQYEQLFHAKRNNTQDYVANTSNTGLQGRQDNGSIGGIRAELHKQSTRFFRTDWQNFPTVSPIHERNDGISDRLFGITFSKWRNEAVKACGNAIVPQVVFQIFKAINEYEKTH